MLLALVAKMIIMVFAPVSEEIREKIISACLAGNGRNKIDRLLSEQGVKVSHGSISNIIARYKREHEQSLQQPIQQQQIPISPCAPIVEEGVDNTYIIDNQEVDFQDQAYETAAESLLSDDNPYNPALDGVDRERLLGFGQEVDISDTQNNNSVVKENASIEEKKFEQSESESALPNIKNSPTLDSESETNNLSLGMDWDASNNYQTRFTKWVMREKRNRQNEKGMLALHWKRLKKERQIFENRRKEFEAAEADLAQRIRDVKELIPAAKELKEIGLDFTLANSWSSVVKTYASKKMVDERAAAWQLANDLKSWSELEGFDNAIKNARHQLELLRMSQEDRKEEIAYFADLRKSGIAKREILELMETVNSKVNRSGFKLDKEMNLPLGKING